MVSIKKEEHFIRVVNELVTEGTKYHLTERELYLWSMLYRDKNIDSEVRTTISLLGGISTVPFAKTKRTDHKVNRIKETLLLLKQKGLITFANIDGDVQLLSFKANDSIRIKMEIFKDDGFIRVPFSKFESFTTMSDYYIFCAVDKWTNSPSKVAKYSLSRWELILQCKKDTVIKKLDAAIENKVIYKNTGDFVKGEMKQEVNMYSTKPFANEMKSNITKAKEIEEANEKYRAENRTYDHTLDDDETLYDNINIFKTYSDEFGMSIFPDVDDYVFYLEIEDELKSRPASKLEAEFIKVAKRRMGQMKDNPKFQEAYEEALYVFENGDTDETHPMEAKPNEVAIKVNVIPDASWF